MPQENRMPNDQLLKLTLDQRLREAHAFRQIALMVLALGHKHAPNEFISKVEQFVHSFLQDKYEPRTEG